MYQGSYVTVKVHKRARVHHASPANRIRALRRRSQPEWRLPYEGVSQRINLAACQATRQGLGGIRQYPWPDIAKRLLRSMVEALPLWLRRRAWRWILASWVGPGLMSSSATPTLTGSLAVN
jgi:hypothetical protein